MTGAALHPPDPVELSLATPVWEQVFTVAPLVLVATTERDGSHDIAPKHMATPLGWNDRYGFVCTPRHATHGNVRRTGVFTVSFPQERQVVEAALTASARDEDGAKPILRALPVFAARHVDGVLVRGSSLYLECELERVIGELDGDAELIVGRIVGASARADAVRGLDIDDGELIERVPPFVYVSPGRFARIGETHAFPFPVGFRR